MTDDKYCVVCKNTITKNNNFIQKTQHGFFELKICKYCRSKKISNSGKNRIPWNRWLTKEIDISIKTMAIKNKGSIAWNKGLTKETNYSLKCISEKRKGIKFSEETKKKISLSKKGKKLTVEHRLKIGIGNRGKIMSDETKKKISISNRGREGSNRGKKFSKEWCKKISIGKCNSLKPAGMLGKKHSAKTKMLMAKTRTLLDIKNNPKNKNLRYKNIFMRSTWEIKVAKWLDNHNIKWEYESKNCIIPLHNGRSYIVDFFLPELNKFLEVKGWWDEKSIYKCDELLFQFHRNKLLIVDKNNIDNISLNRMYSEYSKAYEKFEDCMIDAATDYANGVLQDEI